MWISNTFFEVAEHVCRIDSVFMLIGVFGFSFIIAYFLEGVFVYLIFESNGRSPKWFFFCGAVFYLLFLKDFEENMFS